MAVARTKQLGDWIRSNGIKSASTEQLGDWLLTRGDCIKSARTEQLGDCTHMNINVVLRSHSYTYARILAHPYKCTQSIIHDVHIYTHSEFSTRRLVTWSLYECVHARLRFGDGHPWIIQRWTDNSRSVIHSICWQLSTTHREEVPKYRKAYFVHVRACVCVCRPVARGV